MGYYDFKTSNENAQPALYLGTYNSGSQINVTSSYERYADLTADNFVVEPVNGSATGTYSKGHYIQDGGWTITVDGSYTASCAFSKSYNPSTGVLTIINTVSGSTSGRLRDQQGVVNEPYSSSKSTGLSAKVYLLPEVETV